MPRPVNDRAAKARTRMAETVTRAAGLLRDGEDLSPAARAELVDLLDHLAGDARAQVETHAWDRVMRLAEEVVRPHVVHREGVGKLPDGWSRGEPPRAR